MNLQDVVNMAIVLEKKGTRYYLSFKDLTGDPVVRDMFHRLAEDEKLHAQQFEELLGRAADLKNTKLSLELKDYLNALGGHDFLKEIFPPTKIPTDPKQAIALGIEAEKDSILLFHELYHALPPGEARDGVSRLLLEEKLHLVELRSYLEEM